MRKLLPSTAVSAVAVIAILLVAGNLAAAQAGPAMLVADVARHSATSPDDNPDLNNKTVTVSCPANTKLYSASGRINNGLGHVTMDDIVPHADLTAVTVLAYETDAYDEPWTVTAFAICGSATPNLQRIVFTSPSDAVSPKIARAGCPPGTKLYGLGGKVSGAPGRVFLDDLIPDIGLNFAEVKAYENEADPDWSVTAYAICGNPAATMQRVTAADGPRAAVGLTVDSPACPAGTRLHGVGGEIIDGFGDVVLDDLTPNGALTAATVTGYTSGGADRTWSVRSYGICSS
ncbi:MAG TPA: hypothetical protein VFC19_43665 [Candidatus Limnocylindrales bacterium]|nr:hypothetical protein [Candidatus Limnocylindrales bacterium]